MGARPSQFKKSGGFLNGVDGVITGYQFSDAFNGVAFKPGKDAKGKQKFHSLYFALSVRVDGADEDTTTTLFVGGAEDEEGGFSVSEDGLTLEPVEDGRELGGNSAFAIFITSLVNAGFPDTNLPEDSINYESIIGTRVRLEQVTNVEATKRLGKRKDKKTGKEYDRQDLKVTEVYELPGTGAKKGPVSGKVAAAKAAGKAKAAPAAEAQEADIATLAGQALVEIVRKAGGTIQKAKLGVKVIMTPAVKGTTYVDAVREYLAEDANLIAITGDSIEYNGESVGLEFNKKTGVVSEAAAE